jgi:hypothetical protein
MDPPACSLAIIVDVHPPCMRGSLQNDITGSGAIVACRQQQKCLHANVCHCKNCLSTLASRRYNELEREVMDGPTRAPDRAACCLQSYQQAVCKRTFALCWAGYVSTVSCCFLDMPLQCNVGAVNLNCCYCLRLCLRAPGVFAANLRLASVVVY